MSIKSTTIRSGARVEGKKATYTSAGSSHFTVMEIFDFLYLNDQLKLNADEYEENGKPDPTIEQKNRVLQECAKDVYESILYAVPKHVDQHLAHHETFHLCSFQLKDQKVDLYEKWLADENRLVIHMQVSSHLGDGRAYLFRKLNANKLKARIENKYRNALEKKLVDKVDAERVCASQPEAQRESMFGEVWRFLSSIWS